MLISTCLKVVWDVASYDRDHLSSCSPYQINQIIKKNCGQTSDWQLTNKISLPISLYWSTLPSLPPSPYFHSTFCSFEERHPNIIVLKDIDQKAVSLLLQYIYTSKIQVCEENVQVAKYLLYSKVILDLESNILIRFYSMPQIFYNWLTSKMHALHFSSNSWILPSHKHISLLLGKCWANNGPILCASWVPIVYEFGHLLISLIVLTWLCQLTTTPLNTLGT